MAKQFDLLIIGGGPAGLSAGLYGSRAKLNVAVLEKSRYGGQITTTAEVENYPGSFENCTGPSLAERMKVQAESFGTQFVIDEVIDIDFSSDLKIIKCKNDEYHAKTVIIATGAEARLAGFKNEIEYRGKGVSYCATCDADFFQDLDIAIIGGGDSAITEALYLTKFVESITIIHRKDTLKAAKSLQEKAFNNPKIKFIWDSVIEEVNGEGIVESVSIKNNKTQETTKLAVNGVFVFVGLDPITKLFKDKINLNEYGYIITDEEMKTNIEGVFAAGDVRQKTLRQVITAAADGAISAVSAEQYINTKYTNK